MNAIIRKMLGEDHMPSGSWPISGGHHEGDSDLPKESKEVELARTILSAAKQLPDSPAKDKIVQAATELKQIHAQA